MQKFPNQPNSLGDPQHLNGQYFLIIYAQIPWGKTHTQKTQTKQSHTHFSFSPTTFKWVLVLKRYQKIFKHPNYAP